ncbi:acetyltransferase [Psychromonas marina]|uniref:Acetyltransferase n=1 Tax=Psychromonas marina TaxID=88364 RepID=A0ABQ6DYV8_9GAMM|nr:GNAT family N-acetyltransferase [Psychromonas marina]GLS90135.1 acetyltransferase [Psychromonas marina]
MNIEIRQIQETDIQGFYDALCSVASEGIYLLTTTPPAYEKMVNFVRNNIAHNHAQFVAVLDGRVIGWADIIPLERNTMTHVGHLGMGVLSTFRGLGIGSKLLEKTITHAWEQQLTRLELEVFSDNAAAIKLYNKHHFQIEGVKKNARLYNNHYQDMTIMAQYHPN